jgi:hypothetical protein
MMDVQITKELTDYVRTKLLYLIRIQVLLSEPLPINNRVRQRDALACLLFKLALEKVIRDAKLT